MQQKRVDFILPCLTAIIKKCSGTPCKGNPKIIFLIIADAGKIKFTLFAEIYVIIQEKLTQGAS